MCQEVDLLIEEVFEMSYDVESYDPPFLCRLKTEAYICRNGKPLFSGQEFKMFNCTRIYIQNIWKRSNKQPNSPPSFNKIMDDPILVPASISCWIKNGSQVHLISQHFLWGNVLQKNCDHLRGRNPHFKWVILIISEHSNL